MRRRSLLTNRVKEVKQENVCERTIAATWETMRKNGHSFAEFTDYIICVTLTLRDFDTLARKFEALGDAELEKYLKKQREICSFDVGFAAYKRDPCEKNPFKMGEDKLFWSMGRQAAKKAAKCRREKKDASENASSYS